MDETPTKRTATVSNPPMHTEHDSGEYEERINNFSDKVEAASPKTPLRKVEKAPDCYMCRLLSNYTDQVRCGRCGSLL